MSAAPFFLSVPRSVVGVLAPATGGQASARRGGARLGASRHRRLAGVRECCTALGWPWCAGAARVRRRSAGFHEVMVVFCVVVPSTCQHDGGV